MSGMILTDIGKDKINLVAGTDNPSVEWRTMVFGDGNGVVQTYTKETTEVVNEVYRADVLSITRDATNNPWYWFEGVIPADVGNFWVREIGVIDADGDLVMIGSFPESFKPIFNGVENVAKTIHAKTSVQLSNAESITFVIDPNVVMASQAWVIENFVQKEEVHKFDTSINGVDIDFTLPVDKENGYTVAIFYTDILKTALVKIACPVTYRIATVEDGDTANIGVTSLTKFVFDQANKTWYIRRG